MSSLSMHPTRLRTLRRTALASCLAVAFAAAATTANDPSAGEPVRKWNQRALVGNDLSATSAQRGENNRAARLHLFTKSSPARPAATQTVTNCDDSGPGSLRDLVASAVDGDIIDMQSLTCSTITLTSGAVESDHDISLVGPGQNALTIDGSDNGYVLHTSSSLSIEGVTIANGRSSAGFGGCVSVMQNLTLVDSTVTGCHAGDGTNSAAYGAGVNVRGDLIMYSSTISHSHAEADGGPAYDRSLGGGAYVGGGAYLFDSTISTSSLSSTRADARGGGIFANGVVYAVSSRVADNQVSSVDGTAYGGGIAGQQYVLVFGQSTISGNTAHSENKWSYGGGINSGDVSGGVVMSESTVSGNSITANCSSCYITGGGVNAHGPIIGYYSAITDNHVISASASSGIALGGGLSTYPSGAGGTQMLVNSTVSGNSAIGGQSGRGAGGGLYAYGDAVGLFNSTVASNRASSSGGGAVVGTDGTNNSELESSIVANNEAPQNADVASFSGTVLTIVGSRNLVRLWSPLVTLPLDTSNADPQLLPLADNGGFTKTHAIAECSPAIDAGLNDFPLDWDQRGEPYARESGAGVDVGAFEYQFDLPEGHIFGDGFETPRCP